jgi:vesicle coat complex subunit
MVRRNRMGDTHKVQINLTDSEIERVLTALESIATSMEKIANPLLQVNSETGQVEKVRDLDDIDIFDPKFDSKGKYDPIGPPWVLDE